jgi:YVTN family beta-propeller protein
MHVDRRAIRKRRRRGRTRAVLLLLLLAGAGAAAAVSADHPDPADPSDAAGDARVGQVRGVRELPPSRHSTAGWLFPLRPAPRGGTSRAPKRLNVYAHDGPNALSPVVRGVPPRIYVPNSGSNTVDVIDQRTFKIVAHYRVGELPQHVTPSYDLKTLWVDNDVGNSLTPVSPRTGRPTGPPVRVDDPYNLYFTPGGRYAIVVAERNRRLDFRFAHSMRLHRAVRVPCGGVDHIDFSADGRYFLASCEFSGQMLKVDVRRERVVGVLRLPHAGAMPQDVKLSPDGRVFYVADMAANGVWEINGATLRVLRFLHTGAGAHGLYPSRDSKLLYITNRGEGTISVLDFASRRLVTKWNVGGSPDMGGVSADGKILWLSGRYNAEVYAISTKNGHVLARIPVGYQPHGLCVWPQPGRYSLGHTGILR